MKKFKELSKRAYEARFARYKAEEELDFVKGSYEASAMENSGDTVTKAALIEVA